jgi:hypothetical protein
LKNPAVENLRNHQQQLDADGIMVGVSRQALEETLAHVELLWELLHRIRNDLAPIHYCDVVSKSCVICGIVTRIDAALQCTIAA